jgi:2-polyprenyl-6-methoxyphenol hydroxylase-like FAD-dependent oxidoreductase
VLFALCPLPSTELFQLQGQVTADEPDAPTVDRFQQVVDQRTGRSDIRLYDATWLSLYRANVRMVGRYRVDRVFLAGDAAHVHSPAGGQGMNTGIQDAYNLGWKLGQVLAGARDPLLDTYEEERLAVAALETRWRTTCALTPTRAKAKALWKEKPKTNLDSSDLLIENALLGRHSGERRSYSDEEPATPGKRCMLVYDWFICL